MEDKEKDNAAEVTPAEEAKPETAPVPAEKTKQPKESEPKTVPAEKAAKKPVKAKEDAPEDAKKNEPKGSKEKEADLKAKARKTIVREFLAKNGYLKRYPENRVFYVTSDNMVFLEKDLSLARLHQRELADGEIECVTVNC